MPPGPTRRATPVLLFLSALAVYGAGLALHEGAPRLQSPWPYFVYYARALLDGQLHFSVLPPVSHDLSVYEGRLYMHFPPFPALLLAPFVQVFGLGVPDRIASVLLGALNGVGFHALLGAIDRRGLLPIPEAARVGLSVFFLFGTVHFYLVVTGNPWELAHVVCNGLLIAALLLALGRRYTAAALVYVAILFTRTHVFLTIPVLLGIHHALETRAGADARARLRGLVAPALVAAAGVALLLAFNHARFGDAFENGVSYHAMHPAFRARFEQYGYFDLAYVPRNLYALLFALPVPSQGLPGFTFDPRGLSLFAASPLYVFLLGSLRAPHRRAAALLWLAVAPALVPIALLMGTGELQFGHRYSSDLQVLLVGLAFLGMGARFGRIAWALLAVSVAMNAWGAAWFVSRYGS